MERYPSGRRFLMYAAVALVLIASWMTTATTAGKSTRAARTAPPPLPTLPPHPPPLPPTASSYARHRPPYLWREQCYISITLTRLLPFTPAIEEHAMWRGAASVFGLSACSAPIFFLYQIELWPLLFSTTPSRHVSFFEYVTPFIFRNKTMKIPDFSLARSSAGTRLSRKIHSYHIHRPLSLSSPLRLAAPSSPPTLMAASPCVFSQADTCPTWAATVCGACVTRPRCATRPSAAHAATAARTTCTASTGETRASQCCRTTTRTGTRRSWTARRTRRARRRPWRATWSNGDGWVCCRTGAARPCGSHP